jgi:hypothetical protein
MRARAKAIKMRFTAGVPVIRTKNRGSKTGRYFWFNENLFGAYFNKEHWKHGYRTNV